MKKTLSKKTGPADGIHAQEHLSCEQEINLLAYELWQAGGRQPGEDMIHWLAAEREVLTRRASSQTQSGA